MTNVYATITVTVTIVMSITARPVPSASIIHYPVELIDYNAVPLDLNGCRNIHAELLTSQHTTYIQ